MSVNGITSSQVAATYTPSSAPAKAKGTGEEPVAKTEGAAAVYEPSGTPAATAKKTYTPDLATVNKLKPMPRRVHRTCAALWRP